MPLTYGRHMIFGAFGGGGRGSSSEGLVEGLFGASSAGGSTLSVSVEEASCV